MPRASVTSTDVKCAECDKLLATSEGIKCPRCKTVHSFETSFATELRCDEYKVCFLWEVDGRHASSIVIRKEIWRRHGTWEKYPVFHVYNHLDPSTTIPLSGCRVNPSDSPFLDFQEALALGKQLEAAARSSGKWVDVGNIKEPEVQRPANGVWTFRDLEIWSGNNPVTYDDLYRTLESYSAGWAICSDVVKLIIRLVRAQTPGGLTESQYSALRDVCARGQSNVRRGLERDRWGEVMGHLLYLEHGRLSESTE